MGYEGTLYNLLFVVHIAAIVWAFGPAFAYAAVNRVARATGGPVGGTIAAVPAKLHTQTLVPLIVAAVVGIALVIVSDGIFTLSQPWVSASFTVVILIIALSAFFLVPNLRRQEALLTNPTTDEEARQVKAMVGMGTGFIHLALVVMIVLMVWKPGL